MELDDKAKKQLSKNKEQILSQKVQLRLQQTKCEGMQKVEDDDFKISFNIQEGNQFEFQDLDLDETPLEKLLIISVDNKFY